MDNPLPSTNAPGAELFATGSNNKPSVYRDEGTDAAVAAAVADVQASYTIALAKPRDLEQVRADILGLCKVPSFQRVARYKKPIGGGSVEGWSIRAAEEFVRMTRNIRIVTGTTFETDRERKIRIVAIDLETNTAFGREVTIERKVERKGSHIPKVRSHDLIETRTNTKGEEVHIVRATEDEMAIKEASAVSKVVRNEGLRLVPSYILDEALEVINASKGERNKKPAAIDEARKVVDAFSEKGITVARIEAFTGCSIPEMTVGNVDELREIYVAIRDEGAKFADFEDAPPAPSTEGTEVKPKRRTRRAGLVEKATELGLTVKGGMRADEIEAMIAEHEDNAANSAEPVEPEPPAAGTKGPIPEDENKKGEDDFGFGDPNPFV